MGECNEWERLNLIILISWGVQKSKREIENVNFKGKLFILKKKTQLYGCVKFYKFKSFFFFWGVWGLCYWHGDEVAWILGFAVCVKIWDTMWTWFVKFVVKGKQHWNLWIWTVNYELGLLNGRGFDS